MQHLINNLEKLTRESVQGNEIRVNNKRSTSEERKELSLVDKIMLPPSTMAFYVDMFDPATIKICKPGDDTVLFTTHLGPCIAVLVFCQLKNGDRIIGVAHMYVTDDFIGDYSYYKSSNEEIKKAILSSMYRPQKLMPLLESIYRIENYNGELIEVYFAGGRKDIGGKLYHNRIKYYHAYVNSLKNTEIKGTLYDSVSKNKQSQAKDTTYSFEQGLTAGISGKGEVLLSIYSYPVLPLFFYPSLVNGFGNYHRAQLTKHMENQSIDERGGVRFVSNKATSLSIEIVQSMGANK